VLPHGMLGLARGLIAPTTDAPNALNLPSLATANVGNHIAHQHVGTAPGDTTLVAPMSVTYIVQPLN
jgi:hypothetical protein